jgi:hypothetical protein
VKEEGINAEMVTDLGSATGKTGIIALAQTTGTHLDRWRLSANT